MLSGREVMFKQRQSVQVPAKVRELFVVVMTGQEFDQHALQFLKLIILALSNYAQ
jgi:hypothetical protein